MDSYRLSGNRKTLGLLIVRSATLLHLTVLVCTSLKSQQISLPGTSEGLVIQVPAYEYNYTSFSKKERAIDRKWLEYNPGMATHPDAGYLPPGQPSKGAIEVLSRRTETTRFFADADNPSKVYAQSAYSPLHFRKDGQWQVIDPRLSPVKDNTLEAPRQPEPVGFDLKRKRAYIRSEAGLIAFNDWKLSAQSGHRKQLLATASWEKYTAGDDGIYISDIFPGIDAEMTVSTGQIKTNLIIKRWEFGTYDELFFEDTYSHREGVTLKPSGKNGEVDLLIGEKKRAKIGKAVAFVQGRSEQIDLPYQLTGAIQGIRLPQNLLISMLASGSVVIDPLVIGVASELTMGAPLNSYSHASCSNGFNEDCSYSWQVEVPGGVTVVNVSFNALIETLPPCTRDKMTFKYRFGDGNCQERVTWETEGKPATHGITGGKIVETTLYNQCFTPACQTTYTQAHLSILRSCMGDEGCGSDCVKGIGPFIITVEGRTLELFGASSLQGDQICHGEEIQLAARGEYGMPPYNFQWSPGNLTGDTVTVRPDASTRYTLQITDGCNQTVTEQLNVEVSSPLRVDSLERADCGAVIFEGKTYTSSQILEIEKKGRWGCDSLVEVVNIVVHPHDPKEERLSFTDCEYVEFEGERYLESIVLEDTFTNSNGCDSIYRTVAIQIEEFKMDLTGSVPPATQFVGEPIELTVTGNADRFRILSWDPPELFNDPSAFTQLVTIPEDLTYTVTGESPSGCVDLVSLRLTGKVIPMGTIYPGSFTPNGDGNNDFWTPVKRVEEMELWVYNRWGICVYHTTDPSHAWDGTFNGEKMPPGSYAYKFVAYGRFEYSGVVSILY